MGLGGNVEWYARSARKVIRHTTPYDDGAPAVTDPYTNKSLHTYQGQHVITPIIRMSQLEPAG